MMKNTQKNLSHSEAIQEVYKYTPQIKDYDKFMHIGARWLPYTMYFHEKNFRSPTVNTDALGFRYTVFRGKNYSVAELNNLEKVNLFVGGSTALGVGSTSDATTVASYLSKITGEVWLTFAGRGYNATQEVLLYLMHQNRLPKIEKVVILSGMNTLALEGMPDHLASDHGRYYYSFEFEHYMNKFNEDMKLKTNSFSSNEGKSFFSKIRDIFRDDNPANVIITDEESSLEERLNRAAQNITNAVKQWKLLLAGQNADLHFVLQPLSYWMGKNLTEDEKAVFHAIDSCPNNFYRLFNGVLGEEVHQPFYRHLQEKNATGFCHDMNALLQKSQNFNETIFVDRVHFNNVGNHEMAKLINHYVLQGEANHAS